MLKFIKHHWSKREKFMMRWGVVHIMLAIGVGALLAALLVIWEINKDSLRLLNMRETAMQEQNASQSPPGTRSIGGPFTLVDQDGKTVSDTDFRGKFMLIYFGYTYCPDMCPTGLQSMAKALDRLGNEADKVAPLFITIDPARDTPAKLKPYVAEFHPRIRGLSGTDAKIAAAASAYQVYYAKGEQVDENDYVMDHSTLIYLMGPDGNFITAFPEDVDPDIIVKAIHHQMGH